MSVDDARKKPIIGIVGGIGSGKSTAASEFARLGCKVIDADEIVHKLLDEPAVRKKVLEFFGEGVLGDDGRIDRGRLGEIVFSDAEKLSVLNGIVHPPVLAHAEELIERYNRETGVKAIVLDMPLLVEVGWDKRCDKVIFVDCRRDLRQNRAKTKKSLDIVVESIKIRENFQISLDSKAGITDNTIDNNSGLDELARQVAVILTSIVDNC